MNAVAGRDEYLIKLRPYIFLLEILLAKVNT